MTSYELTHFKKMVRVWKTKLLLFCLRYDLLIVFRRQNHITFISITTMPHDLLVQNGVLFHHSFKIACAIRTIKHDRQIQDVKRMFSVAYILKIAVHIRWVVCSCYFSVRLFVNCPSFPFAIYKTWTELAQTRPQGFLVAISFSGNIAVLLKTSE